MSDVDPRLVAVIEEALTEALPYVDSYHLGDAAICVADDVWEWLAEGDPGVSWHAVCKCLRPGTSETRL